MLYLYFLEVEQLFNKPAYNSVFHFILLNLFYILETKMGYCSSLCKNSAIFCSYFVNAGRPNRAAIELLGR